MNPSVIMIAEPNVIKQDKIPSTVSKNRPKNDDSNFFICKRDILKDKVIFICIVLMQLLIVNMIYL